jgi:hypothetical protein
LQDSLIIAGFVATTIRISISIISTNFRLRFPDGSISRDAWVAHVSLRAETAAMEQQPGRQAQQWEDTPIRHDFVVSSGVHFARLSDA